MYLNIKKIKKYFKKGIDKMANVCYDIYVIKIKHLKKRGTKI